MSTPRLVFLAGPNGAGKATFYQQHLAATGLRFVNADQITAKLGIRNEEAAAAADGVRSELIEQRISFITETVFSDPVGAKLQFLREAIEAGFSVTLIYVGLVSPHLSSARVSQRVERGGHDVPDSRLARCYEHSLKNLVAALEFIPEVYVFDNSAIDTPHRLVLKKVDGRTELLRPVPTWLADALRRSNSQRIWPSHLENRSSLAVPGLQASPIQESAARVGSVQDYSSEKRRLAPASPGAHERD